MRAKIQKQCRNDEMLIWVLQKNRTQSYYPHYISNFLELLEPGDTILADRGFTIADDIGIHGATLQIPAFTRGKKQLSQKEVEVSKQLSKVRIHVERAIGMLKNKYIILKGTLPVDILRHNGDTDIANIDSHLCSTYKY